MRTRRSKSGKSACFVLAAACLCLCPLSSLAADGATLEDWISAALDRDPDLREAQIENSWQQARIHTREVWEDPELRIGREQREDRGDQTSVRLRVPIPNPWESKAGRRAFEARAEAGYLRMEAIAWEKSMALATRYYEAVFLQDRVKIRTLLQSGFDEDLEAAEKGFEARVMTRDRLIDLKAEHAIASARLAKDKAEWLSAINELRTLAGWTESPVERLGTPLPVPLGLTAIPDLEALRQLAFREEGELGALSAEQREEEARMAGSRSRSIPWITFLEGTWLEESDRNREDFEVRIGVTLPVFSWLRRSQTEEALRVVRSRDRIKAYSTALETALDSAWHKALAQESRLTDMYKATEESIREIEAALESRGLDPRRRSGLRDRLMDLQDERLDAAFDYQMALLDLMNVCGPGYPITDVSRSPAK